MENRKHKVNFHDMLYKLPSDVGSHIGSFLPENKLREFRYLSKRCHTFFSGASELREKSNIHKYAFHNQQNKINIILKRYPGLYQDKAFILNLLLHHISFGQKIEALNLLKKFPNLITEYGTVNTHAGYVIADITPLQLAYVLEDAEICHLLWDNMNEYDKSLTQQQLITKIAEIDQQEFKYVDYNYSRLINAMNEDQLLKSFENKQSKLNQALNDFNLFFEPNVIKHGRPFNMQHLCKAYEIFNHNWQSWNAVQLWWFSQYIIARLQNCVSTYFAQFFSNGINNLKHNQRSLNLKNTKRYYFQSLNVNDSKIERLIVDILTGNMICLETFKIKPALVPLKYFCQMNSQHINEFKQRVLQSKYVSSIKLR